MQDVCLFAHFDRDDRVDDYVLRYLGKIRELNFSIVFISTSRLTEPDIGRLRVDCCDVILRDNLGLDFGSWSAGFARHGASIGGRLLLANDSVYGPIGSLATAFDRLTRDPADFYGFVESSQIAPHLQSWFLLFEPRVVRHPALPAIMAQPFADMTKRQVIREGEIDLSRRLTAAGFRYNALYRDAGMAARCYRPNAPHLLWRELLFEKGVPFLKIELLRDNPAGAEDAETILSAVEALDTECGALIRRHLARTRGAVQGRQRPLLLDWFLKYRRFLVRNGYRFHRDRRRVAELANLVLMLPLIAAYRVRRLFRLLTGTGTDPG